MSSFDPPRRATKPLPLPLPLPTSPEPERESAGAGPLAGPAAVPTASSPGESSRFARVALTREPDTSISVPDLLVQLHRERYSGRVRLRHGDAEQHLWWTDGRIVFARADFDGEGFAAELVQIGVATPAQVEAVRERSSGDPIALAHALAQADVLKASEVPRLVRRFLRRKVGAAFPWREASCTRMPGELCRESIQLDDTLPQSLLAGIRERMGADLLWSRLGKRDAFPRLRGEGGRGRLTTLARELELPAALSTRLAELDGRKRLDAIVEGDVDALAVIYALAVIGVVELLRDPVAAATETHAAIDRARIVARLRLVREADYFAVLGLSRDARAVDVRRAYADLEATFDDAHLEPEIRRVYARELAELRYALTEARDVLFDDALRNAYLAHLEDPA